ncbi:uncharacterized protein HMPREF1541_02836 [Cyphellophora europaea CBS 101466]|uniref:Uncharacterized protein n=1 Tax=Cyphellophora europaea (strain CBS 101466) TaxID=1220924 RepID=W2S4Q8_CYPE1|nr:uncharacterized protein HMPREF1541_02836 [Cyphellophora europaea CBS 101466]ETN43677.1 hypothetical protein HMPREF1541_02836 [Cyphellophora europaea CBS 101466]
MVQTRSGAFKATAFRIPPLQPSKASPREPQNAKASNGPTDVNTNIQGTTEVRDLKQITEAHEKTISDQQDLLRRQEQTIDIQAQTITELQRRLASFGLTLEVYVYNNRWRLAKNLPPGFQHFNDVVVTIDQPEAITMDRLSDLALEHVYVGLTSDQEVESKILIWQEKDGYHLWREANASTLTTYLLAQQERVLAGGTAGIGDDGEIGIKVLFWRDDQRDLARQNLQNNLPVKPPPPNPLYSFEEMRQLEAVKRESAKRKWVHEQAKQTPLKDLDS